MLREPVAFDRFKLLYSDGLLDKNYVGVFLIWDHLFGSFQEEPCLYGIRGQLKS